MQIFYSSNINNGLAIISQQENQHLVKVLRKQVGDIVYLANGKGTIFEAEILQTKKKESLLKIKSTYKEELKNNNLLSIAIAPTKSMDRFEWFIEKAIEIGINSIIPFYSQHAERKVLKMNRLQSIALSAMKQSKTLYLPLIHEIKDFKTVIQQVNNHQKYIAYLGETTIDIQNLMPTINYKEETIIFIGPEGGFSEQEINLANENHIQAISLGEKRLRTETAGIYACSAYQLFKK